MGPCPYAANMATNSKTTAIKNNDKWTETFFHKKKSKFLFPLLPQWFMHM